MYRFLRVAVIATTFCGASASTALATDNKPMVLAPPVPAAIKAPKVRVAANQPPAIVVPLPRLREATRDKLGMVTFSFDIYTNDNPLVEATSLVEKYGLVGDLFLTTGNMGSDPTHVSWESVSKWTDKGWELGSRSDADIDMTTLADAAVSAAVAKSGMLIIKNSGLSPVAFAAPGVKTDPRVSVAVHSLYDSNIVTFDYDDPSQPKAGFNDVGQVDPYHINRVMITSKTEPKAVCDDIAWAAKDKRWLVIGVAQVMPTPSDGWYQVSTKNLDLILDCAASYAKNKDIRIVTIKDGLKAAAPITVSSN